MFLGEPLFLSSLRTFVKHPKCRELILVVPESDINEVKSHLSKSADIKGSVRVVTGGTTRSESVANGINVVDPTSSNAVFVHDAARPGLTARVLDELLTALATHHGAAPAIKVVDALKHWNDNHVSSRSRNDLYRIQTPQAFRTSELVKLQADEILETNDEFELAENAGLKLTLIEGDETLGKVTYPKDLERLEALLTNYEFRTGFGYDVHAFEEGDRVILGGCSIPHDKSLKGHSDADVLWHALTDALLGTIAAGDIGDHFPPSDEKWRGEPSITFLKHAAALVKEKGGEIVNLDATIICESPKIKPYRDALRENTSAALDLDLSRISIKATTTERLGFEGREEGIAVQACATVKLSSPT